MSDSQKKISQIEMVDYRKVFTDILKAFSGSRYARELKYNLFYQIIGFKGVTSGVGCSTIVANVALALADLGLSVCVMDTSVLHPSQDELLKTNYKALPKEDRVDWYDMPFSQQSPLNISKINRLVSVLSCAGKGRTMLDMIGTMDSDSLIDIAIAELEPKFDVILIDLCDEPTNLNITAMQKAQQVIQVWSDANTSLASMDETITNNVMLSCPMDKMRYVVENKTVDDTIGNLDTLYKEYRFKRLSHCTLSYEIARVSQLQSLWKYATTEQTVIDFNNMVIDIVCHICNISKEGIASGEVAPRHTMSDAVAANESVEPPIKGIFGGIFSKGSKMEKSVDVPVQEEVAEQQEEIEETEEQYNQRYNEGVSLEEPADKKGLFGRRKK